MPVCDDQTLYYTVFTSATNIYSLDVSQPVSATNPKRNSINFPTWGSALAVSPFLSIPGAVGKTFYTVGGGVYYYYDGTNWINTGHSTGGNFAVNIGAGGGFIYSLDPTTNKVYRYDGTGNSVNVLSLPGGFTGVADVIVDTRGNFYLFSAAPGNQHLQKYSPSGALLYSWALTNLPTSTGGGGFSIIGNQLYFVNNTNQFYKGTIRCTSIDFESLQRPWSGNPFDFAECSNFNLDITNVSDSLYFCTPSSFSFTASGLAPYNWQVIDGNATVTGAGPAYTVQSSQHSKIVFSSTSVCGTKTDTIETFHPSVSFNIDRRLDTVYGCGLYVDTLHMQLNKDTTGNIAYNLQWSPVALIRSGNGTTSPVVAPSADTTFYITITTPADQGGCQWKDSIRLKTVDRKIVAGFTYDIRYGCNADTVIFKNTSTGASAYVWKYDDGTSESIFESTHVFTGHRKYSIQLVATNGICADSTSITIDLTADLAASFVADRDSICQGATVQFTNTSIVTRPVDARYMWAFGDNLSSTAENPSHTFNTPGSFDVKLFVTDFRGCMVTATHTIVVDPAPAADFDLSDATVCAGSPVTVTPHFTQQGAAGISWNMGTGPLLDHRSQFTYVYDAPGTYTITMNALYPRCGNVSMSKEIQVNAAPVINLGNDTSICHEEQAFMIGEEHAAGNWIWNTGATESRITIKEPGKYIATVSLDGCAVSDTIVIDEHTCNCRLTLPDAFSPNSDGRNDVFRAITPADCPVRGFELNIYNRWGQLIYNTTDSHSGWDGSFGGTQAEIGTYMYMMRYSIGNFEKQTMQSGELLLVR